MDSGTSLRLVCAKSLGEKRRKKYYASEAKFATANSIITSTEVYDMKPLGLLGADGTEIVAPGQVLPDCPSALSPGLSSKNNEMVYWWPPGSWQQPPQLLAGATRGPEADLAYSIIQPRGERQRVYPLASGPSYSGNHLARRR